MKEIKKKENPEIIHIKCKKFALLIKTYGAIHLIYKFSEEEVKNHQIINDLLDIVSVDFCDPIILAAVCNFVTNLLENDKIEYNLELIKYISMKSKMFHPLLPYLGDFKYQFLCNYISLQGATGDRAFIPLANQGDERVHELFVQIVRLVKYFSMKSLDKDHPSFEQFSEVTAYLNE